MRKLVLVSADPDRIGSQLDRNPKLNRDIMFISKLSRGGCDALIFSLRLEGRKFPQRRVWEWWVQAKATRNLSTMGVS